MAILRSAKAATLKLVYCLILTDFSRSKKPMLSLIITHPKLGGRQNRNCIIIVPDPIFSQPDIKEKVALRLRETRLSMYLWQIKNNTDDTY